MCYYPNIFFFQTLLAGWDTYEGEQLVLFCLAPGIGDQFSKSCEDQMLPSYFQEIASNYPEIKAKVIAIDPLLSQDPTSIEYAFLKGWSNDGLNFRKNNIEIQCFNEYIPSVDEEYIKRVEDYLSKILENGGAAFIGHHGQAYYAFEPFRIAYNKLKCNNLQMYICCADYAPFSTPKVYWDNLCSNDELDEFFEIILPYMRQFITLYEVDNKEACYQLFGSIIKNISTKFTFYRDILDLPYKVIRTSDGNFQIVTESGLQVLAYAL